MKLTKKTISLMLSLVMIISLMPTNLALALDITMPAGLSKTAADDVSKATFKLVAYPYDTENDSFDITKTLDTSTLLKGQKFGVAVVLNNISAITGGFGIKSFNTYLNYDQAKMHLAAFDASYMGEEGSNYPDGTGFTNINQADKDRITSISTIDGATRPAQRYTYTTTALAPNSAAAAGTLQDKAILYLNLAWNQTTFNATHVPQRAGINTGDVVLGCYLFEAAASGASNISLVASDNGLNFNPFANNTTLDQSAAIKFTSPNAFAASRNISANASAGPSDATGNVTTPSTRADGKVSVAVANAAVGDTIKVYAADGTTLVGQGTVATVAPAFTDITIETGLAQDKKDLLNVGGTYKVTLTQAGKGESTVKKDLTLVARENLVTANVDKTSDPAEFATIHKDGDATTVTKTVPNVGITYNKTTGSTTTNATVSHDVDSWSVVSGTTDTVGNVVVLQGTFKDANGIKGNSKTAKVNVKVLADAPQSIDTQPATPAAIYANNATHNVSDVSIKAYLEAQAPNAIVNYSSGNKATKPVTWTKKAGTPAFDVKGKTYVFTGTADGIAVAERSVVVNPVAGTFTAPGAEMTVIKKDAGYGTHNDIGLPSKITVSYNDGTAKTKDYPITWTTSVPVDFGKTVNTTGVDFTGTVATMDNWMTITSFPSSVTVKVKVADQEFKSVDTSAIIKNPKLKASSSENASEAALKTAFLPATAPGKLLNDTDALYPLTWTPAVSNPVFDAKGGIYAYNAVIKQKGSPDETLTVTITVEEVTPDKTLNAASNNKELKATMTETFTLNSSAPTFADANALATYYKLNEYYISTNSNIKIGPFAISWATADSLADFGKTPGESVELTGTVTSPNYPSYVTVGTFAVPSTINLTITVVADIEGPVIVGVVNKDDNETIKDNVIIKRNTEGYPKVAGDKIVFFKTQSGEKVGEYTITADDIIELNATDGLIKVDLPKGFLNSNGGSFYLGVGLNGTDIVSSPAKRTLANYVAEPKITGALSLTTLKPNASTTLTLTVTPSSAYEIINVIDNGSTKVSIGSLNGNKLAITAGASTGAAAVKVNVVLRSKIDPTYTVTLPISKGLKVASSSSNGSGSGNTVVTVTSSYVIDLPEGSVSNIGGQDIFIAEYDDIADAAYSAKKDNKGEIVINVKPTKSRDYSYVRLSASGLASAYASGVKNVHVNAGFGVSFDLPASALANDVTSSSSIVDVKIVKANEPNTYEIIAYVDGKPLSTTGFIPVKLPYTMAQGETADKIVVFNAYSNAIIDKSNYDGSTCKFFLPEGEGKYYVGYSNVIFNDLGSVTWAENQINYLGARNVLNGMEPEIYAPNNNVTRAQFAKMLVVAFGLTSNSTSSYSDVNSDAWYAKFVAIAADNGIVLGYEDGTFRPENEITREEMAVMVARACKAGNVALSNSSELTFGDNANIQDYAKESISILVNSGILKGMENNEFAPKNQTTRAQAGVVVYNLYKLILAD